MAVAAPLISSGFVTETGNIDSLMCVDDHGLGAWVCLAPGLRLTFIAVHLEVGAALLEFLTVGVAAALAASLETLPAAALARVF